jgi:hypothetical protein
MQGRSTPAQFAYDSGRHDRHIRRLSVMPSQAPVNEPTVRESRLTPLGRFAILSVSCSVPIWVLLAWLGHFEQGMSAAICQCMVAIAVRPWWARRRRLWLWSAILVASVAQIPLVVYVPWSSHALRGGVLLAFGLADYTAVYGIIWLAAKLFGSPGPEEHL